MVRVKICGNRSLEEVSFAIKAGADAVGLIVGITHFSEDALEPDIAGKIVKRLPPFISSVLVTHLTCSKAILDIYREVPVSTIQIHDAIDISEVKVLREKLPHVKLIGVVHIVDHAVVEFANLSAQVYDALILDSRTHDRLGGTGKPHDWNISREIVNSVDKPVILAGGLNPENVAEAIEQVNPWAIDVNSGVDRPEDGSKDPQLVQQFVAAAKQAIHSSFYPNYAVTDTLNELAVTVK